MATAVRRGATPAAAAVAAELLHEGHEELLGDIAACLASSGGWAGARRPGRRCPAFVSAPACACPPTGHTHELGQLAAAAARLGHHTTASLADLARLLTAPGGGAAQGSGTRGGGASAVARAASTAASEGLKEVGRRIEGLLGTADSATDSPAS